MTKNEQKLSNLLRAAVFMMVLFGFFAANGQSRNRMSVLVAETKLTQTFQSASLFNLTQDESLSSFVKDGSALLLDAGKLQQLMQQKNKALTLSIPTQSGKVYELELVNVDITSADFKVGTKGAHATENTNYEEGLYYRGIIKNDFNSIAAVSLFNDEVMIVFSNNEGNFVLGKVRNGMGKYALYNDKNVIAPPPMECATDYTLPSDNNLQQKGGGAPSTSVVNCKVVHCYYECDFAMYQAFSSNTTTTANYMTSIFNVKATLYANDGMTIEISQIYVWTSTDPMAPYTTTSTVNNQFISYIGTNFNGDMANFITTRNLGGGIAQGFSGLCNKSQAHCTSMIYTTYSPFPTYSWTVMVITHEMGHLLGSRHTHACVWNGNNTAIDGCSGATEGGCALPGNPAGGGTIMSYCHLTAVGINFNNGFGPQPAALLLGNITNAACLTGGSASTPTGLFTNNIKATSAKLNWAAVAGATQYTVEYKMSSSATWIVYGTFTTPYKSLQGLLANTSYDWRVNADCSPMSTPVTFTTTLVTGCGVPTGLLVNNIGATTARLNWNAYAGASNYKTRYRVYGTTTWTVGNIATAYRNLTGLTPNTQYQWSVKALCNGVWTNYTGIKTFTTASLQPPTGYCASNGSDATYEYINNVQIGSINNTSGNNGGYADYTAQSTSAALGASASVSVTLIKNTATDIEYVSIFVDFNRDGDFADAGETAYSSNGTQSTFTGTITVPASASIGLTRMRVSMQYAAAPPVCGTYTYGEVEDYLLNITGGPLYASRNTDELEVDDQTAVSISPNPVKDQLTLTLSESDNYIMQLFNTTGQLVKTIQFNGNTTTVYSSELPNGIYQVKIVGDEQGILYSRFIKN